MAHGGAGPNMSFKTPFIQSLKWSYTADREETGSHKELQDRGSNQLPIRNVPLV